MRKVLAILLLTSLAIAAVAQDRRYVLPTLEWLTDSSDIVVRASLTKVVQSGPGTDQVIVQIHVVDVLKGRASPELNVAIKGPDRPPEIGHEGVWFLRRLAAKEGNTGGDDLEKVDIQERVIDLDSGKVVHPALGMDLNAIETQAALVAKIKSEAERTPQRTDGLIRVPVPSYISVRVGLWRGETEVIFPKTAAMEHMAREWVLPQWWLQTRQIGVAVLAQFKSPENLAILRELAANGRQVAGDAVSVLDTWGVPVVDPDAKQWPAIDLKKATSSRQIRVTINGKEVSFKGVSPPRIIGASVYARACTLSEAIGVHMYSYNLEAGHGVWVDYSPLEIYMPEASHRIWVAGLIESVDYPSYLIKNEGFFPVRYVAEKLGATVRWDPRRSMVLIETKRPAP